jgi:hypothetical protein
VFKGNVARNIRIASNTIEEVGLLSCKFIHLPIVGINIPDDDYKYRRDFSVRYFFVCCCQHLSFSLPL